MKNSFICAALLCLSMAACRQQESASSQADVTIDGDEVTLLATSPINKEITIHTVRSGKVSGSFSTVGNVRAQAGKLASVGVPFDGRTTRAYVRLGQKVKAGQPLFGFFSTEIAELTNACFQANSNCKLATRELERKKTLHESGIVSDRELDEAQSAADIAAQELLQSQNALRLFGVDVNGLMNSNTLSIVSPISGEVVECEVVDGQFVKSDSEPLVTVAELGSLWVEAQVKEHYIGKLAANSGVQIIPESDREHPIPGRIHYVGQLLDEATRSIQVTVSCDNQDGRLKPGMYVHVEFISEAEDAIQIPASAVMQGQESSYVYVKTGDYSYQRRNVVVATADNELVTVLEGLKDGEEIITKGGIFLTR